MASTVQIALFEEDIKECGTLQLSLCWYKKLLYGIYVFTYRPSLPYKIWRFVKIAVPSFIIDSDRRNGYKVGLD